MQMPVTEKAARDETVDLVIVGGGAAGLMAGLAATESLSKAGGPSTLLIEGNDCPGRKLLATGNGRCNLSNRFCGALDFNGISLEGCPGFVEQALNACSVQDTLTLFSQIGIPVREDGGGRLYPYSMQAVSVRDALVEEYQRRGGRMRCGVTVDAVARTSFAQEGGSFMVHLSDGSTLSARCVILSTGGKAGAQYGCTGDGYRLAEKLGHSVTSTVPALVQLESDHPALKLCAGVRARGTVTLMRGKKKRGEASGEIQFTEKGLSGICVFDLSRFLRDGVHPGEDRVWVDLFPEQSQKKLLEQLTQRLKNLPDRPAARFLDGMLHQKLSEGLLTDLGILSKGALRCSKDAFSFEEIQRLAERLKAWEFPVTGTRPWNEAQVTAGGVALSGIDKAAMESKRVPGLYFAGELLDVDGRCGGFNLQWAWTSGFLAGKAAAGRLSGGSEAAREIQTECRYSAGRGKGKEKGENAANT